MIEVVCNDRLGKKVFVLLMTLINWATGNIQYGLESSRACMLADDLKNRMSAGACQVQRRRHDWRPQEAHCGADWYPC